MVRLAAMSDLAVALVAEDPLARAGLAMLLATEPVCKVVAQMSLADWLADLQTDPLVDAWSSPQIDGVIWDVGWELLTPLPDEEPFPLPVVALLPDETAVAPLWQIGIKAMLRRDASAAAIMAALQAALHGMAVLDPDFAPAVLPETFTPSALADAFTELTPRESDVLILLAEGLTNKAIAHQLEISDHTVKFHVNAILGKLSAQSRTEAVVQATRLGLLRL